MSLIGATKLMDALQPLDPVERLVRAAEDSADLDIDAAEELRRLLGNDAAEAIEQLKQFHTELSTESTTVLLIDLSRSMIVRGRVRAAKRLAMALNSLIKGQYPQDNLYVVGFSYLAKQIAPEDLPSLTWQEWAYGTNMQHALVVARDLLATH